MVATPRNNPGKKPLNIKQRAFVQNLTTNGGRKQKAARDAGYSAKTAHQIANNLLKKVEIQNAVEKRLQQAERYAGVTRKQVLGMFGEIAASSLADVLDDNGELDWNLAKARGKDHLIREVVRTERHSKDGSKRVTHAYKMYSRQEANDSLKEIFGMHKQAAPNPIESAREMLAILKEDVKFADLDEASLREIVGARLNVSPSEIALVSEAEN